MIKFAQKYFGMLKKITNILFSTRLMAVLFIAFAIAMATGTFLDASGTDSPTPYSRELIYNAWWFEVIMLLFAINFLGNIKRYQLHKLKNWATLSLHLAFLLIFIGAFITRYISYEGIMHIREGDTTDVIVSEDTYLKTFIDGDYEVEGIAQRRVVPKKKVRFDERLNNNFKIESDYLGQDVKIQYVDYLQNAKHGVIPNEEGEQYIEIVESSEGIRESHYIKMGGVTSINGLLFSLNNETDSAINLYYDETTNTYSIETPYGGSVMTMATQETEDVYANEKQDLKLRALYDLAGMSFVLPQPIIKGDLAITRAEGEDIASSKEGLIVDVTSNGETKRMYLLGGKGHAPNPTSIEVGGLTVHMTYSSKIYRTPFKVQLREFIADKYPGTEKAYKTFQSDITVYDDRQEAPFDYEIYMNHVLNYDGFRFFQSSFDPDEQGTYLSVNHDFWGTWITYIGYGLLYLGLLAILFDKNTRFGKLRKQLRKLRDKKARVLTLFLLLLAPIGFAQENHNHHDEETGEAIETIEEQTKVDSHQHQVVKLKESFVDSLILSNAVSKKHADVFAHLIIQDQGRMKPINTFASELLRRVSHRNDYHGLDPNQVFISMSEQPRMWFHAPLIYLPRGNDSIRKIIGVDQSVNRVALIDLFSSDQTYKLGKALEIASTKSNPSQFEKDILKAHENYYLLNLALSGGILKIFPEPQSPNNKWISRMELNESNFQGQDSLFVKNVLPLYYYSIAEARETGDYEQAEQLLEGIHKFQQRFGSEVIPSDRKIEMEVLYNKLDIFNKSYKYFMVLGIVMFILVIAQIFKDNKILRFGLNVFTALNWVMLIALTLGLGVRWYVSGHAPMSDAYESVVYVAWATILFGLIMGRKSHLTIASTAFVGAIVLWVAHLNWMDPAIGTLDPVLDSYWLMIHVSVIVMSYGPFTLGFILGTVAMLLMILTNNKNKKKMDLHIQELTIINEMALTVGLVLLTIGNFLGGQWANESWGRYWGWDPKETWALISIMIYAFVIHARLVPGLRGRWTYNMLSIFAYASIMMTYFGVNFYLAGLHSYASGDVTVTPTFVYYITIAFIILSAIAYFRNKKYYSKKK